MKTQQTTTIIHRTIQAYGHDIRQFSVDGGQSWHMDHALPNKPLQAAPVIVLAEPFPAPQERPIGFIKNRAILVRKRGKRKIIRPSEEGSMRQKVRRENLVILGRMLYPASVTSQEFPQLRGGIKSPAAAGLSTSATRMSRGIYYSVDDPTITSF